MGEADERGQQADELIVRALAAMGYDALNAGAGELRAGPMALRRLAESSAPALTSGNGKLAPTKAADAQLVKPYLIRQVAGVRLGLVGVASPDASDDPPGASSPAPPVEALRAILPEVRRKADVIVALADLEPGGVEELASAGLDLQVVLGARTVVSQAPRRVGQTIVAGVGGNGRYVGRLTLLVDAGGRIASFEDETKVLDPSIPDDPGVLALRREYP